MWLLNEAGRILQSMSLLIVAMVFVTAMKILQAALLIAWQHVVMELILHVIFLMVKLPPTAHVIAAQPVGQQRQHLLLLRQSHAELVHAMSTYYQWMWCHRQCLIIMHLTSDA